MATRKYRPYLTLSELKYLRDLAKDSAPAGQLTLYLDRYILDIDSGYRKENHVSKPTIQDKLGFSEPQELTNYEAEQLRRYENDEMSPDEESAYELSQGLRK